MSDPQKAPDEWLSFSFDAAESQRLDKFLVACLPGFSRARLQSLIEDGLVLVGGEPARKAGQSLDKPCRVQVHIPPPRPSHILPEEIPLEIVFENGDVIVVNKPAGMVVHPAPGHDEGTLVHAALAHAPEMEGVGGVQRPGVVHRLDKDTSGLILLAKNDAAHQWLQAQFKARSTHKTYLALVDGAPPTPTGRIEAPVGRNTNSRKQMAIVDSSQGREAFTEYHTLETFPAHTLVEAHPITGRTHQIRLHLAFIGCPVVGDRMYGRKRPSLPLARHFLHAARLQIALPGESTPQVFEAPLPQALKAVLDSLRQL
ncbi:MAG: RluA family pseudouridine synthase [Chloroflexota bacterium]